MNKLKIMLISSLVLVPCVTFAGGYGMSTADLTNANTTKTKLTAEQILNMSSEAENPTPYIESGEELEGATTTVTTSATRRTSARYTHPDSYFYQMNRRRGGVSYSTSSRTTIPTKYRRYTSQEAYQKYLEEMKATTQNGRYYYGQ